MPHREQTLARWVLAGLIACSDAAPGGAEDPTGTDPSAGSESAEGETGQPDLSGAEDYARGLSELVAWREEAESLSGLNADALIAARGAATSSLGYDPTSAANWDLIQDSRLALTDPEVDIFREQGFVISDQYFSGHVSLYGLVYSEDLPVFISADSILYAWQKGYTALQEAIEVSVLIPEVRELLNGLRLELERSPLPEPVRSDLDVYLTTAFSLLAGWRAETSNPANARAVGDLFELALAAEGQQTVELFGPPREVDFSQFVPRSYYAEGPDALQRYFRALMWLGRIDFRLVETLSSGELRFNRRQVDAALALDELLGAASSGKSLRDRWTTVEGWIELLAGEPDALHFEGIAALRNELGVSTFADAQTLSDDHIQAVLLDKGYGRQRIASHLIVNGPGEATFPLSRSFLVFPQRYLADSHVLSNVVYDRVISSEAPERLMPDPLDVAYAGLGNPSALPLLRDELERYAYAPELELTRRLIDAHGHDFWSRSVASGWLNALRGMSSTPAEIENPGSVGLPSIAKTDAWGRRVLNTQLASWAELRHAFILYGKQSYTSGLECEYPDAYVDPYPELFGRLAELAEKLRDTLEGQPVTTLNGFEVEPWLYRSGVILRRLEGMARRQRAGEPMSAEDLAFVNRVVRDGTWCGSGELEGWYADLILEPLIENPVEPIVADVHTQPTDAMGNRVGKVLHVGIGRPRAMVVAFETCNGVRAYVGPVSSYLEHVTRNFERLTDDQWKQRLSRMGSEAPQPPAWMFSLSAP